MPSREPSSFSSPSSPSAGSSSGRGSAAAPIGAIYNVHMWQGEAQDKIGFITQAPEASGVDGSRASDSGGATSSGGRMITSSFGGGGGGGGLKRPTPPSREAVWKH